MFTSRSIQGIIILVAALFLAVWLGVSIVTKQLGTIFQITAATVIIGCIFLGRRIWLLVPFMAALALTFRIPGQPSSLLLGQFLALAFCTLLFLMRRLLFQLKWTELEFWMLILTLFVAQVYVRNPVSVSFFGGDTVGGKGYILYGAALASALLFCGIRVPPSELKCILPLSIFGGLANAAISVAGTFVPTLAFYTNTGGYTESTEAGFDNRVVDQSAATRIGFLGKLGNNLSLWISAHISPLKALFKPLWAILILGALVAAMLSGFRNTIASVGLTILLGIAYRSGIGGVVMSIFAGIVGVALLAVINMATPLPPNIQRSLSFLPGTWEERYILDAQGSSEWRFEMWREVLLTDRWIQNKWLGDGLGFSAAELVAQMNQHAGNSKGISGFDAHRESILSNGDYHSGPVSSIRVVGYIGLIFFLLAQIRLAVHAHRQIIRCHGTEWLPLALFTGIPLIFAPLLFVFIFGDFKTNSVTFLLAVGMMRLLENNLPLPAYISKRKEPYLLQQKRTTGNSPAI